jgi:hypothetical protein
MDKWDVRRILRTDIRDAILFLGGLLGVMHETLVAAQPREVLLLVFAAMMGLPAFLRLPEDKVINNKNPSGKDRGHDANSKK